MASKLIGRVKCTECDFEHAHVKIKTDPPEGKVALAYRHCPECGAQFFPRSKAQADRLTTKMRPEGQTAPPAPPEAAPAAPAAAGGAGQPAAVPAATSKGKRGFLDGL